MAEDLVPFPRIDPAKNQIILCIGRKGSGKSQWAREAFRHWAGVDRLVIDPTGDADPGSPRRPGQPESWRDDLNTELLKTLPRELPPRRHVDGRSVPGVYRWIANTQSPSYRDDLDRAVALGLFPKQRRTLLWIDEAGPVFPSNSLGPNALTLLQQSRHFYCSALICCPRPLTINPLVLAQADRVVMFDVPAEPDRKRLAETLGWPYRDLVSELNNIRKYPFSYLMYVASEHAMYACGPIPLT